MENQSDTDRPGLTARKALLAKEKALTAERDALAAERQQLPWERVTTPYRFEGPDGMESLGDLFGNCSQLMIYHFMFGPDDTEGCPTCSLIADSYANLPRHLAARDVAFVTVSRAPLDRIESFKRRMGWNFKWVSSRDSSFNNDFDVTFTAEELDQNPTPYNYGSSRFPATECPGLSIFAKDEAGSVFHTYSTYSRGLDQLIGVYPLLGLAPKGRDESGLPWSMAWIRHRDAYDDASVHKASALLSTRPGGFRPRGPYPRWRHRHRDIGHV